MPKKIPKIPRKPVEGKPASEAHKRSIWNSSFIPQWANPATEAAISAAEERLGICIAPAMKTQLLIQNGGVLPDEADLVMNHVLWLNAAIDKIWPVEDWTLALNDNWFESVQDVDGLELLVKIAGHSESQLCLDYRSTGRSSIPAVTFIEVCMSPTMVTIVCDSIEDFISALIESKLSGTT